MLHLAIEIICKHFLFATCLIVSNLYKILFVLDDIVIVMNTVNVLCF